MSLNRNNVSLSLTLRTLLLGMFLAQLMIMRNYVSADDTLLFESDLDQYFKTLTRFKFKTPETPVGNAGDRSNYLHTQLKEGIENRICNTSLNIPITPQDANKGECRT